MSTFYTTFLSKSDFSFVLLLVTFEPLEVEQSYIPLLKALICGINVVGAQGCSCMSTFCHAPLKIALWLHEIANGGPYSMSETVLTLFYTGFVTYVITRGGGSTNPTRAKSFVRQPICILGLKIGYQYNILVFSNP